MLLLVAGLLKCDDEDLVANNETSSYLKLNVGGTLFYPLRSRILPRWSDSKDQMAFRDLVESKLLLNQSNEETIYIDRNPTRFNTILDYLRSLDNTNEPFKVSNEGADLSDLVEDAEYYGLGELKSKLVERIFERKSRILTNAHLIQSLFALLNSSTTTLNLLNDTSSFHKSLRLVYRASEDGFDAHDFHRHCDDKSNTITLIRSLETNSIFGGFKRSKWRVNDFVGSFVFSLRSVLYGDNKWHLFGVETSQLPSQLAFYGPTFGSHLHVCSNANLNNCSYSFVGVKRNKAFEYLLAGANYFLAQEIECFQLQRDYYSYPLN